MFPDNHLLSRNVVSVPSSLSSTSFWTATNVFFPLSSASAEVSSAKRDYFNHLRVFRPDGCFGGFTGIGMQKAPMPPLRCVPVPSEAPSMLLYKEVTRGASNPAEPASML